MFAEASAKAVRYGEGFAGKEKTVLKYSLGTLFLVVAVAGLGCAAFVNFSETWVRAMFALALVILALAVTAAVVGRGSARTFACGFSIVGGVYFLLAFMMSPDLREDRLITGRVVDWLHGIQQRAQARRTPATTADPYGSSYGSMDPYGAMSAGYGDMGEGEMMTGMGSSSMGGSPDMTGSMVMGMGMPIGPVIHPAPRELQDIGHCLWALILGAIGGVAAQGIARRGLSTERPAG
jgi:hypothetical protein